MATILDIGALQHFSGVFPFLLVLVLVYAILTRIEFFKEKHGIAAIIAVILALLTATSRIATKTINIMSPWLVLFLIFGIILLIVFMAFGVKEDTITKIITGKEWGSTFFIWILTIILIITIGSLISVINEEKSFVSLREGENTTTIAEKGGLVGESGFWKTIFHPKVLGMAVVLLVAYFTISKLSKES